jgi:folate receptor
MMPTYLKTTLLPLLLLAAPAAAWEDTCTKFSEIYTGGQDLCETMWGDAFSYETDESKAFTMWWVDGYSNPNDAIATKLNKTMDTCELQYFHKSGVPTAESSSFTECHPWQDSACCYEATVTTPTALKEAYGEGYEWDRCGTMSQACERFFVQEACFYECDVNAGAYRKCSDAEVAAAGDDADNECAYNTWELYKMPIKKSYCDAWYKACYNDYFCGGSDGNYFSCAEYYSALHDTDDDTTPPLLSPLSLIIIPVLGVLVVLGVGVFLYMRSKERAGVPVFTPLVVAPEEDVGKR